jgi:cysteine desulfurase/selenocysteine lyase
MHEITPNLIAEIATRLLNDVPGGGSVPKSEVGARAVPAEALHSAPMPHAAPSHSGPVPHYAPPVPPQRPEMQPAGPTLPTTPLSGSPLPNYSSLRPSVPAASFPNPAASSSLPAAPPASAAGIGGGAPVTTPDAPSTGPLPHSTGSIPPHASTSSGSHDLSGLQAFVQRIRGTHSPSSVGGGRVDDEHHDLFRRLFQNGGPVPHGSSRAFDVASIRRDFPVLHQRVHGKPLIWFDNAATTQKPQSVIDTISRYYANDNSNIHRAAHTLAARSTDAYEQARQKVQMFLGASSAKEIIFVRGTTEGINLIAQTYGKKFFRPGDEIVLSTLEHHANIVPWQMVAKETGAVIRVVPVNDRGEIMLEEYQALLGPRTKFVALTQASNGLGTVLPVQEMTQMAKRYNARVLIDGAQSVAHMPVNLQTLGADFFVFSGHKVFGPTGIGAVFAKEELQEIMPPWQGGGNMIKNVTFEETTYNEHPAKFEAGTPNIADAVGLGAALDYVSQLGLPNIARYEHELTEYGTQRLSSIPGLRLIGTAREKVGVLSFVLPERRTEEIGRLLDQEGIAVRSGHHCAQPSLRRMGVETTVRPSLSIYNTKDEIDCLADAVKRIARR